MSCIIFEIFRLEKGTSPPSWIFTNIHALRHKRGHAIFLFSIRRYCEHVTWYFIVISISTFLQIFKACWLQNLAALDLVLWYLYHLSTAWLLICGRNISKTKQDMLKVQNNLLNDYICSLYRLWPLPHVSADSFASARIFFSCWDALRPHVSGKNARQRSP